MMGAPEAELRQDPVRLAHEVAIGEEQQFKDIPDGLFRPHLTLARRRWAVGYEGAN
jgi:2'-5' RNA ligase